MKIMLNRQILMDRYGIADVSLDGLLITRENGNYAVQMEFDCKHKYGKTKTYYGISAYDKVHKNYISLLVHNVVYAWYNDDYDVNMDIDHIDGDSLNNKLDNLRQVDRLTNIRNRDRALNQFTCNLNDEYYSKYLGLKSEINNYNSEIKELKIKINECKSRINMIKQQWHNKEIDCYVKNVRLYSENVKLNSLKYDLSNLLMCKYDCIEQRKALLKRA